MQLPVDVNALMNELADVQAAREMPLAVSVYIDETAPENLAAHVRNAFASSSSQVRMTVTYVGETFNPHPTDDIAIIVAGLFIGASIIAPYGGDYEVFGVPFFSFFGFAGAFVLSVWVIIDIWRYG